MSIACCALVSGYTLSFPIASASRAVASMGKIETREMLFIVALVSACLKRDVIKTKLKLEAGIAELAVGIRAEGKCN